MRDTKQQWFKEAKYGLFIHWGLYSLLAGEYQGRRTKNIAEWIMNDLDIPPAEYEKLAGQFNPVNFNADDYVRRACDWGMKYLTFTSKHHDGFAMYHSTCSPYNVVDATPCGRDIVGELAAACKKYDVKFCLYYSQAQDWHHPDGYRANHDNAHKNFRRYLDEKCLPQIREILTGYGEIAMIWFDTPMGMTPEESQEVHDLVKSIQPDCIVSGRIGNSIGEYMTTGDDDIPSLPFCGDWEVPATLNGTWGFNRYNHDWRTPEEIVRLLVKINSRGGNYLLNIGPMADGAIPQPSIDILDRVGEFLHANGESIYATRLVKHYVYDKEDVIFTARDGHVYIHMLRSFKRLTLNNITNRIEKAYLLAGKTPISFMIRQNCEGDTCWLFEFPQGMAFDSLDTVLCVEIPDKEIVFESLK